MSIKKIIVPLFLLTLLMHCFFIYADMVLLRAISKLLLMPLLITYLYLLLSHPFSNLPIRALAGLFFSFLGDALLIGEGSTFFLSGMIAFVLAHLNYSFYFLRVQPVTKTTRFTFLIALLLLLIFSSLVFVYLDGYLGAYQLPVMFYMLFISLMASLAIHVITSELNKQFALRYFIPGAILFIISDAILAMNLFRLHEPLLDLAVMLTYGMAQFFLVKGFEKTPVT